MESWIDIEGCRPPAFPGGTESIYTPFEWIKLWNMQYTGSGSRPTDRYDTVYELPFDLDTLKSGYVRQRSDLDTKSRALPLTRVFK